MLIKSYRKSFIPAALVCLGVEQAPGALPCNDTGINKEKECNPYEVNVIKKASKNLSNIQQSLLTQETYNKNKSTKSLYNRKTTKKDTKILAKKPVSFTIYDVLNDKIENKKNSKILVKAKDKEIKLKNYQYESKDIALPNKQTLPTQTYTYIVKEGDSLSLIAKEFGLNIKTILRLNNLTKNSSIKIGQKLKLPKRFIKIVQNKINKKFHMVKKGDTLSSIASIYNISVERLIKYNNLSEDFHLKIGQKIYLIPKRENIFLKITKRKNILKAKRVLNVTATAYTSHASQTDKTPFLAAWNNKIRPGMKIIAVSRDLIKKYGLTNGVKVKIKGLPGIYTVRDKMNKKFRKRIDIYMGLNKQRALKWGKRKITLLIMK